MAAHAMRPESQRRGARQASSSAWRNTFRVPSPFKGRRLPRVDPQPPFGGRHRFLDACVKSNTEPRGARMSFTAIRRKRPMGNDLHGAHDVQSAPMTNAHDPDAAPYRSKTKRGSSSPPSLTA